MVPSVDFKVYGVEQDFRMFMCTKRSVLFSKYPDISAIASGTSVDSTQETLRRLLVTEPVKTDPYYVEINEIWKWTKSVGFNVTKRKEQCVEDRNGKRKKQLDGKRPKILVDTEDQVYAEIWTKSYLQSIGSSGVIHSMRT